jgi:phage-related protein
MGILSSISNAIGSVWSYAKSGISHIANAIGGGIKTVYSDGKTVITDVHQDAQSIVKGANQDINNVTQDVSNLGEGVLSTLKIPLILIGGGVLLFMMGSGKNSSFTGQASYNR